jgi:hypothetical protein
MFEDALKITEKGLPSAITWALIMQESISNNVPWLLS